jgi:dihydrolipoamide dehydrogenase
MNTKDQLGVEYILNAKAEVIDNHTVEVCGERYTAKNLASGERRFPRTL